MLEKLNEVDLEVEIVEIFDVYDSDKDVLCFSVRDMKNKLESVMMDYLTGELSSLIQMDKKNQEGFEELIRRLDYNEPQNEISEVIEKIETMITDLDLKKRDYVEGA